MKSLLSIILLFPLILSSCATSDDEDPSMGECGNGCLMKPHLDCSNVRCTEEFRMITGEITDGNGNAPYIKDYRVFTDENIELEITEKMSMYGRYIICTDAHKDFLRPEGTELTVKYVTESDETGEAYFIVGRDCCHIFKIENKEPEGCEEVNCTHDIREIFVDIKDEDGYAMHLHEYRVFVESTGKEIYRHETPTNSGRYMLCSDQHQKWISSEGTVLSFQYLDDKANFGEQKFTVGKDCCHVYMEYDKE